MDELKSTYIQEAQELLENLESSLLSLEDNPNDKSNIEQVFRVMHTLKGNSSMFGLTIIAEFVHDLETIYDKIRQSEMELSKPILNTTLASLDHLKMIIYDSELSDAESQSNHHQLIKEIHSYIAKDTIVKSNDSSINVVDQKISDVQFKTFHIYFHPDKTLLQNGSNPLFLINELSDLGKTVIIPYFNEVEDFTQFEASECITYWDIILETKSSKTDILDIFIFVEDKAIIEINEHRVTGVVNDEDLITLSKELSFTNSRLNADQLDSIVGKYVTNIENEIKDVTQVEKVVSKIEKSNKPEVKEKVVSSIRVSSDKLDELMNLVSELVTTQASLSLYTENQTNPDLEIISENIEKLSRRLRDISFGMTLVQINTIFSRFQRLVRVMCGLLGKEVQFITEGGETELDKTIIETLTDPLMHIIRNSMDHGIETGDVREANGKERVGTIKLRAYYSGISVYLQIIDDGKGINVDVIRSKAISKGFMKPEDQLTDKEIFDFIFYPGFSTAEVVTDVSGRGVGMDVVNRNISDLKGTISVESKVNQGTTLTIKLPLSLSIIDGLLVEICGVRYIIPLSVVNKCYEVHNYAMQNNFNKLLILDEHQVPFINLREEFDYEALNPDENSQLIVVSDGDNEVGISVDFIVGEYQAVVKPISKYYKNQDFVSGATILGDGSIALVLDTHKIVELYQKHVKMEARL